MKNYVKLLYVMYVWMKAIFINTQAYCNKPKLTRAQI